MIVCACTHNKDRDTDKGKSKGKSKGKGKGRNRYDACAPQYLTLPESASFILLEARLSPILSCHWIAFVIETESTLLRGNLWTFYCYRATAAVFCLGKIFCVRLMLSSRPRDIPNFNLLASLERVTRIFWLEIES